jgi:site-specific DNA-methyltransferase (adenine-specific)
VIRPDCELILIFRKPVEGTVAENVLKWGTGAINIDECRVETKDKTQRENKGVEWGDRKPEYYEDREKEIFGSTKGRFPANLVHDGSDEVVELFPEQKSGAMLEPYEYTNTGFSLGKPVGQTKQIHLSNSGSAARFFYCAKADKGERDLGLEQEEGEFLDEGREEGSPGGTNPRNRGAENKRANYHPTVKPVELMKWLITLVSRKDSLILDPFAGSGSTLVASKKLERKAVGIERDEGYCKLAIKRLKAPLQKTFD